MNLPELMQRIHETDPLALPGGPGASTPEHARLVLAAFNAVRQALNRCSVEDRVTVPGLGQFRLRNDHAATGAGSARRLVLTPEQSARTAKLDRESWQRALRTPMLPLVHPRHRFVVLFSAKSACTTVVIWFLHTMGLMEAARSYSHWPHDFRIDRLYKRQDDASARETLEPGQARLLRVVRDPFERAASSFRHALGTSYARESIRHALGVDTERDGLSFERYLDFLEREDLRACDPHHALQNHPLERLCRPDRVINVSREDLFAGLHDFERLVGLPPTDFGALRWIHELQAQRAAVAGAEPADAYRAVLTREQALQGPWPGGLLTDEARARLARLYAPDLGLYAVASYDARQAADPAQRKEEPAA